MERLKLAISKARDTAIQSRNEPSRTTPGDGSPRSGAATVAGFAEAKGRSWMLAVPLSLGLAAAVVFWTMQSDAETEQAGAKPAAAPKLATTATPPQPAEPALPADAGNAAPASAEEPATAQVATEPDKPMVPLSDQVEAAVELWRQAWSKRDMTAYLDAYSEAFTPSGGVSREDWVASRYRNVGGRKSINVQIKDLQVQPLGEDRARVSFLQDYTSGSFRETAQPKTLELVLDGDEQWRIVGEWQGDAPPVAEADKS